MRPGDGLRIVRLLGAAVVLFALAASAASAAAGPLLVEASGSGFPDRSYVLTLPAKRALTVAQVHVTENGRGVQGLSLVSEQASAQPKFAVVFVIDASNSMRGRPIAAAMAAARAFEAHRSAGQALGVIAFNGKVRVLLTPTTDANVIAATLARTPSLAEGTKIYDALDEARTLLESAGAASGSIVLLSDGADTGSVAKPSAVLHTLAADHLRVFSVGLNSSAYDPATLSGAASGTGGSFVEAAKPAALAGIFDSLGSRLSNQYLIGYRSTANPGTQVAVRAVVEGVLGTALSVYSTPALHIVAAPPYHPSHLASVVQSPWTAAIVAIVICALFGWGILTIVGHRSETVPSRVGHFVAIADPAGKGRISAEQEAARFLNRRKRPFERHRYLQQLETTLSVADIKMSAGRLVALTTVATVVALWVSILLIGGWGILLGLMVPFIVRSVVLSKRERRRRAFSEQLPENLEVLASALRTGHSLSTGLAVVVDNSTEPSKSELQRVLVEEQLGVRLEDALKVVVDRMDNRDIDQLALVARLQRDMGTSSAEVLDRVIETVRARMGLRRLVRTLTAQGRFSRWVLTALPIGLALVLTLLSPGYLSPLFHHSVGRFMLVLSALMVVVGSLLIGKIVNIKV